MVTVFRRDTTTKTITRPAGQQDSKCEIIVAVLQLNQLKAQVTLASGRDNIRDDGWGEARGLESAIAPGRLEITIHLILHFLCNWLVWSC